MAWFEDLAECNYFPVRESSLRAVGWLERGKVFATGTVDGRVYATIKKLAATPWQPFVAGGAHACDLCAYEAEASGSSNVFVPGAGVVYACPELVCHYMNAHHYRPPEPFCEAVLMCPEMRSMEYLKALLAGGARG